MNQTFGGRLTSIRRRDTGPSRRVVSLCGQPRRTAYLILNTRQASCHSPGRQCRPCWIERTVFSVGMTGAFRIGTTSAAQSLGEAESTLISALKSGQCSEAAWKRSERGKIVTFVEINPPSSSRRPADIQVFSKRWAVHVCPGRDKELELI